jgi:hypothetical protein
MVAGRKPRPTSEHTVFKKVSVYEDTHDLIKQIAVSKQIPICSYIEELVRKDSVQSINN